MGPNLNGWNKISSIYLNAINDINYFSLIRENFWANLLVGFSTLSIVCAIAQVLVSSLAIGDRNYYSSLCKLPIVVYECEYALHTDSKRNY